MGKLLALALILFCAAPALAAPGAEIGKMMSTPASVFDVFLLRLYEAGKCNRVVRNNNADEADLCLSALTYDADKNILTAFFRVLPGAEVMDDFVDLEADGRRGILLGLLTSTARRMGAVDTWGLLHSTPLGHAGQIDNATQKAFRSALAARTTTRLSTSYDGVVYLAIRHHDGRVEYFTNK